MEFDENEIEQEKAEKLQIKIQLSRDAATASFNDSINFGQKNSDLTFGNDMAKNGDQSCRNSQMLKNSFDSPSPIKINKQHKDSNCATKDGLQGMITSGISSQLIKVPKVNLFSPESYNYDTPLMSPTQKSNLKKGSGSKMDFPPPTF